MLHAQRTAAQLTRPKMKRKGNRIFGLTLTLTAALTASITQLDIRRDMRKEDKTILQWVDLSKPFSGLTGFTLYLDSFHSCLFHVVLCELLHEKTHQPAPMVANTQTTPAATVAILPIKSVHLLKPWVPTASFTATHVEIIESREHGLARAEQ